jgi:aspartyl-tRNA(Asn)/glutamyl-tRNA(Gln) amidotransferase subunit A
MSIPFIQDPGRIRDLSAAMAKGEITAEALVQRYLDRIAAVDGQVKAWIHVLADVALAEARALDAERKAGKLRGPLHGMPVGIKDVIDVRGLPTRANSPSRADIAPASADATVVAHLRAAGAIVLGKLHTTEYAFFQSLPPTRNPWDLARTPGGSSAGSGAAIAAVYRAYPAAPIVCGLACAVKCYCGDPGLGVSATVVGAGLAGDGGHGVLAWLSGVHRLRCQ